MCVSRNGSVYLPVYGGVFAVVECTVLFYHCVGVCLMLYFAIGGQLFLITGAGFIPVAFECHPGAGKEVAVEGLGLVAICEVGGPFVGSRGHGRHGAPSSGGFIQSGVGLPKPS